MWRRPIPAAELALWRENGYREFRVRVRPRGEPGWTNLSSAMGGDWVLGIRADIHTPDQPAATFDVRFLRRAMEGATSRTLALGINPLLEPGTSIEVEARVGVIGGIWHPWRLWLQGEIEETEWPADEVVVHCQTLDGVLMAAQIEVEEERGAPDPGVPIETEIQSLLNEWWPGDDIPTLRVIGTPDFNVGEYGTERGSLGEWIRTLAGRRAWDVRFLWWEDIENYALTLYLPPRDKDDPDYLLPVDEVFGLPALAKSRRWVRNAIRVPYINSQGDEEEEIREDLDSIAAYRRQAMSVPLSDEGLAGNAAQAGALADYALSDLSRPLIEARYQTRLIPWLELHDVLAVQADGARFSDDRIWSVVGGWHEVTAETDVTELELRGGTPTGQYFAWWRYSGLAAADGGEAQVMAIQYASDDQGSNASTSFNPALHTYARWSENGGATWTDWFKIVGEDGASSEGRYTDFIFRVATTQPPTPTGESPAGWFDAPPVYDPAVTSLWMSRAERDGATGALLSTWSAPVRLTGEQGAPGASIEVRYSGPEPGQNTSSTFNPAAHVYMQVRQANGQWPATWARIVGEDGVDGVDGEYVDYRFRAAATQPATPVGPEPSGWQDAPPSPIPAGQVLWMVRARKTMEGALIGTWSVPVRITGPQGQQGLPGPPGSSAEVRYSGPTAGSNISSTFNPAIHVYMQARIADGTWPTGWARIVGEDGEPGADGLYYDYRFRASPTQPETPTGVNPTGWFDAPPSYDPATSSLWMSRAQKDARTNALLSSWSTPVRLTGDRGPIGPSGADGVAGSDGQSIVWRGEFSLHPSNPQNGWAYRNTSDGRSYVYQDGTWYQMTIDGVDGQHGTSIEIRYSGPEPGANIAAAFDPALHAYMQQRQTGSPWPSEWARIVGERGADGEAGEYVDHIFRCSDTQPDTPVGIEPWQWSDGPEPCAGVAAEWMSTARKKPQPRLPINNYSETDHLNGWSPSSQSGLIESRLGTATKDGQTVRAHWLTSEGDTMFLSDPVAIDPQRSYEVRLSHRYSAPAGGTWYVGIYVYDEDMQRIAVVPFSNSTRQYGSPSDNLYFYSEANAPVGVWTDVVAYLMAAEATDPDLVPVGQNALRHARLPAEARFARLRYLNWGNAGTARTRYFWGPQIRPADELLTSWSTPIRLTGEQGPQGMQGQQGVAGAPGESAIMALLSNDSHVLPATADGAVTSFGGAQTTISVFEGRTDASAQWGYSAAPSSGITGSLSGRTYTVTGMTSGTDSGHVDITASRSGYPSVTVRFALTKARGGQKGDPSTSYWLTTDAAAIKRSLAGAYTPASLVVGGRSATGESAPVAYAGRFQIATTTNGTTWTTRYTSSSNQSSYTYAVPAGIIAIRVRLYAAGGTSNLLDEEVVPVVEDGPQGPIGPQGASAEVQYSGPSAGQNISSTFQAGTHRFMRLRRSDQSWPSTWSQIVGEQGLPGSDGRYTDYIYRVATTRPATPTGNNPSGWSDAPPTYDPESGQKLWYSRATKEASGTLVGTWSEPVQLTGPEGPPGLSIRWRGESSSPPSNPQVNDVYRDTDNQRVYIWTGTAWELMVLDGDDGPAGAAGQDGWSVYITYHQNPPGHPPARPTGNGTSGGWSTVASSSANWISQKVASSASAGEWGAPIRIRGADSGRIIFETFSEIPPGLTSTAGVSIVEVDGTAGGTAMQVAGGFRQWYPNLARALPWDADTLYRIEVRMRVVQDGSGGSERLYAGVRAFTGEGQTIPIPGGSSNANRYIVASNVRPSAADGWITYVGWLRGIGPHRTSTTPDNPAGLIGGEDAAWIAPMVGFHWDAPTTDQITQIDYVRVEAVATELYDIVEQASADAVAMAAGAQATADGKVTTFFGSSTPTAKAVGDLWIHTGEGNRLRRWNGSTWVVVQDEGIGQAIAAAATAEEIADGKIRTFYQDNPPTGMRPQDVGDLWVDTNDNNHLHRWSGSSWVSLRDGTISIAFNTAQTAITDAAAALSAAQDAIEVADGKIVTFFQSSAPTPHGIGDLWIHTGQDNRLYRWDGTTWSPARDGGIAQAITTAAGAQAAADGKIRTFFQTTAPTGMRPEDVGDLWIDTSDYNHPYRWSGSAWVSVRDGRISHTSILEVFRERPPGIAGTTGISIVSVDGASGGSVLQVDGYYRQWYPGMAAAIPFNPTAMYRLETRMRVTRDDSSGTNMVFYAGLRVHDRQGGVIGGNRYVLASAQRVVAADGWVTYVAWVRGTGANRSNAWNPANPSGVNAPEAAFISPMLLLNYSTPTNQITQVDFFRLEQVDTELFDVVEQAAADATAMAAGAQATADGKIYTFFQSSAPTARGVGDLWIHTGEGNRLRRWNGSTWVVVQDQGIGQAIAAAATAEEIADGKIRSFYQPNPPGGMRPEDVGDLWIDTDDGNHLYRWSGSQWVSIRDGSAVRQLPPLAWITVPYPMPPLPTITFHGENGPGGSGLQWRRRINNGSWSAWSSTTLPQSENIPRDSRTETWVYLEVRDAAGNVARYGEALPPILPAIGPGGRIDDGEPMVSGHQPFRRGHDTLDQVRDGTTFRRPGAGYVDSSGRVSAVYDTTSGILRDGGYIGGGASRAHAGLNTSGRLTTGTTATATESGGRTINRMVAKPLPSDPDHIGSIPDGGGYARTTVNERALILQPNQNHLGRWANQVITTGGREHGRNTLAEMGLAPGNVISVSVQIERATGSGSPRWELRYLNSSGSAISTVSDTSHTNLQTRRVLEGLVIPANTHSIAIVYLPPTGGGTVTAGKVMLNRGALAIAFADAPIRGGRDTFADLDSDASNRVYKTITGERELAENTVVSTPVVALNVARGVRSGSVRQLDPVEFDPPFDLPPAVLFGVGGLSYHPGLGNVRQQQLVQARDLDANGFSTWAVIRAVDGTTQERTSGAFNQSTGIANKSVAAAAADDTYTFRFSVTLGPALIPEPPLPPAITSMTLSFATNDGSGWFIRATRTYTNNYSGVMTYSNQEVPVVASGLTSGSHQFRVRIESQVGSSNTVSRQPVTWVTASAPAQESMTPSALPGRIPFIAVGGT